MNFYLNAGFSLLIGVGAIIGWVRFNKTDPAFLPFLLLLSIGFLNESISIIVILGGYKNSFNYSIFKLLESFLINWQFLKWRLYNNRNKTYLSLQFVFLILWISEQLLFQNHFRIFSSFFSIIQSLILVSLSIRQINNIVFTDNIPLWRHPVFLICIGFIIYFTYDVGVEMFMILGLTKTPLFRINIYHILIYINLFINVIFICAVLCFPMRKRYIMQL
jgi:hypothetical protein